MKLGSSAFLLGFLICCQPLAQAELALTAVDSPATINFDGFTGAGFDANPGAGQLDSDTWSATGFSSPTDLSRGSSAGGVSTGGVYAFDTGGGNVGLGVQPTSGDFTPGAFTLTVRNSTGSALTSFDIAFDVGIFNDQTRGNSFNFEWSTDNATYINGGLDVTSAANATGSTWDISNLSTTINFASPVADDTTFFLRWSGADVDGSGSRDEFALDNISLTGRAASVPEPSAFGLLAVLGIGATRRRSRKA